MDKTIDVLVNANRAVLAQGDFILSKMPDDVFYHPARARSEQVGAHFRHVLDHYTTFLNGYAGGMIDFSGRERKQEYEQNILSARGLISDINNTLSESVFAEGRVLQQRAEIEPGKFAVVPMTVESALLYLREHSIHHYALVRVLAEAAGNRIDEESFGCHPSTLRYLRSNVHSCKLD